MSISAAGEREGGAGRIKGSEAHQGGRDAVMRKIGLVILAVVAVGLIVAWLRLPVLPCVVDFLGCVERAGMWGPVALGLFYVVFCVLLVPGSIPTLAAGFLLGVGIVVVLTKLAHNVLRQAAPAPKQAVQDRPAGERGDRT